MENYKGPAQYRPLTAWQYFWLSVLYSVPVVGFVFLIVFSFSKGNINRRSYTRSYWCGVLIGLIVVGIAVLICLLTGSFAAIGATLDEVFASLPF